MAVSSGCFALAQGRDVEHPPFPVAGKFSRTVQTVTGLNWLSGLIASKVAAKVVGKKLGAGDVKVKVKPYSMTDLISGKVKSVKVQLKNCSVKSVPIGSLELASANPLWYDPGWHHRKRGIRWPIMFNLKGTLDREQITAALNNPKVSGAIRGLKLDLPGLGAQQMQILHPVVDLADNKATINAVLVTQGAEEQTGLPVTISGRPSMEGSKVFLRDMSVQSPDIPNPEEFSKFMDELFNPLFDMGRLDRQDHAVRVTSVQVKQGRVDGIGTLVLAPKPGMAFSPSEQVSTKHHGFWH
jgi:hypothetical protein